MEYENDALETRMVVVDRPNVRDQLRYKALVASMRGDDFYVMAWEAAKVFIEDWECEHVGLDDDLEKVDNPAAANVIAWAGMQVFQHYSELEDVPKN